MESKETKRTTRKRRRPQFSNKRVITRGTYLPRPVSSRWVPSGCILCVRARHTAALWRTRPRAACSTPCGATSMTTAVGGMRFAASANCTGPSRHCVWNSADENEFPGAEELTQWADRHFGCGISCSSTEKWREWISETWLGNIKKISDCRLKEYPFVRA